MDYVPIKNIDVEHCKDNSTKDLIPCMIFQMNPCHPLRDHQKQEKILLTPVTVGKHLKNVQAKGNHMRARKSEGRLASAWGSRHCHNIFQYPIGYQISADKKNGHFNLSTPS